MARPASGEPTVTWRVEVLPSGDYPKQAAARIAASLPVGGPVIVTGGRTAAGIYPHIVEEDADWSHIQVLFSDERCVVPTDRASNYGMANRLFLSAVRPQVVHRMRGEARPEIAAAEYSEQIAGYVADRIPLALLGLGEDCHIAGLFPGSPLLSETERLCASTARPDGLPGVTLTPPALHATEAVILIASGRSKAEAVSRAALNDEDPEKCPVRLLAGHGDVTLLVDEGAAMLL